MKATASEYGSLIPDVSILLWAVGMTWRLDTHPVSPQKAMQDAGVEISLVDSMPFLSQSDFSIYRGLSNLECIGTILAAEAGNRGGKTSLTLGLRLFSWVCHVRPFTR
jgi:hypothetical protein